MRTIQTVNNQSLIDLAIQLYGHVDAVEELMNLNYDTLRNYYYQQNNIPLHYPTGATVPYEEALPAGINLQYDDKSPLRNDRILRSIARTRTINNERNIATAESLLQSLPYAIPPNWLLYANQGYNDINNVPGSYRERLALIRLYHDLLGSTYGAPNPLYPTVNVMDAIMNLFPFIGDTAATQNINHMSVTINILNENVAGGIIIHSAAGMGIAGGASLQNLNNAVTYGMEIGFAVTGHTNAAMGCSNDPTGQNDGMQLYTIGNTAYFCPGGRSHGLASGTIHVPNNPLLLQGSSDGNIIRLYQSNQILGEVPYDSNALTSSQQNSLGTLNGVSNTNWQANYVFAYVATACMSDEQRRTISNAILYFLFNKGLSSSFQPVI